MRQVKCFSGELMSRSSLIHLPLITLWAFTTVGCSNVQSNQTQPSSKLNQSLSSPEVAYIRSEAHEPKLEGIPLSCRVAYIKAIARTFKAEDETSFTRTRQHYDLETIRIANAFVEAGWYEEGLKSFEPGSYCWGEIAQAYAAKGELSRVIQLLNATASKLQPEFRQSILAELYVAANNPKQAIEKIQLKQSARDFSKAELLIKIAALFAQAQQFTESGKTLAKAMSLVPPEVSYVLLPQAAQSFAEVGQFEQALQFVYKLSSVDSRNFQHSGRQEQMVGDALVKVAQAYSKQGYSKQANALLPRVEKINLKLLEQQRQIDIALNGSPPSTPSQIVFSGSLASNTILTYADIGEFQKAVKLSMTYFEKEKAFRSMLLLKIGKRAWEVHEKELGIKLMNQALNLFESSDENNSPYRLLEIAENYRETGRLKQAKLLVDKAFSLVKPIKSITPSDEVNGSEELLFLILRNYAVLAEYSQALATAQAEVDPPERERLINLVQCASR